MNRIQNLLVTSLGFLSEHMTTIAVSTIVFLLLSAINAGNFLYHASL